MNLALPARARTALASLIVALLVVLGMSLTPTAAKAAPVAAQTAVGKKVKLSYKEQRELEELPLLIASLEDEQSLITAQLNAPDFYKTNPADAKRINARFEEIDQLLIEALEKWELIEARSKG